MIKEKVLMFSPKFPASIVEFVSLLTQTPPRLLYSEIVLPHPGYDHRFYARIEGMQVGIDLTERGAKVVLDIFNEIDFSNPFNSQFGTLVSAIASNDIEIHVQGF